MQQHEAAALISSYLREIWAHFPEKAVASGGLGFVGALLGGLDLALVVLLALMAIDLLLGLCRAVRLGRVSAAKLKGGLLKFVFYGLSVMVAMCFEVLVALNSPWAVPVRDLWILYLGATEACSALDHLAFFNVPVPERLRSALREYRDGICFEIVRNGERK
jgi:toxin secretion/phage lysis holin